MFSVLTLSCPSNLPPMFQSQNSPSWNICDALPNDHEFWGLMRALFGYTCRPTPVEIIAYVLYWVFALTFMSYKLMVG